MRLGAVVALVVLAGCLHCGPSPAYVTWTDPALWEAVEAPLEPQRGASTSRDHLRVLYVSQSMPDSGHPIWEHLMWQDGVLVASLAESTGPTPVEAALRRLLENATTMDPDAIDSEVAAFMATEKRVDVGPDLNGDPDEHLGTLVYETELAINGTRLLASLGLTDAGPEAAQAGGFSLGFDVDRKTIDLDGIRLRVDAFGRAEAQHRWSEGVSEAEAVADVQEALAKEGLPPAQGTEVQTVTC